MHATNTEEGKNELLQEEYKTGVVEAVLSPLTDEENNDRIGHGERVKTK